MNDSKIHVAIIMDGNGRWAQQRGLPRAAGHRQGVRAVRRIVEAAPALDIGILTLYAFSSDNWKRPSDEVRTLMRLFRMHLASEASKLRDSGVRLQIIGRRDRLPEALRRAIEHAESITAKGDRLLLRLAIDYSARDAILHAAALPGASSNRQAFAEALGAVYHTDCATPDVDLLIRTGGEQRLSDFLLWECAYAELYFTPTSWPDYDGDDLREAIAEFRRRDRRYGSISYNESADCKHAILPLHAIP